MILDANPLIEAKNGFYAFDRVPGYWTWLLNQSEQGVISSIKPVYDELHERSDDLTIWANQNQSFFLEIEGIEGSLKRVADWTMAPNQYIDAAKEEFLEDADSFLVAYCLEKSCTLVTQEKRENRINKIKIPNACDHFGVPCINIFELMQILVARF